MTERSLDNKTEALKLSLEALKQIDEAMPFPVAKLAQQVIREALAEQPAQQQEPVAIVTGYYGGRLTVTPFNLSSTLPTGMALYTSPPASKPWVGLTDEEVIIMSRYDLEYAALIGEVQRKLKEKNT